MDSLIEAITELVVKELAAARLPVAGAAPAKVQAQAKGPRLLVVPGSEPIAPEVWTALDAATVRPSSLIWGGFRQDQLPASAAHWPLEARAGAWSKVVADYAGVVLIGSDLPTLGSIATLGAGGAAPSAIAVAAVASGVPVFCEGAAYEQIRRHSARLAPGFVRAFEDSSRTVASFGVELGGSSELGRFLGRFTAPGGGPVSSPGTPSGGGRDVVTAEDVDAARRAGQKELLVGMGAIVTPLARQQASEWGIEVKFQ